jgi:hypothetical protein
MWTKSKQRHNDVNPEEKEEYTNDERDKGRDTPPSLNLSLEDHAGPPIHGVISLCLGAQARIGISAFMSSEPQRKFKLTHYPRGTWI